MIVNGVTLPDIPAEVLAEKPNAVILHDPEDANPDEYSLYTTKGEIGYVPPSITGDSQYGALMSSEVGYTLYLATPNSTEWTISNQYDSSYLAGVIPSYRPDWANLDIYEITSVDMNTGAYTKGDIWFPNSETPEAEYAERYSILGSILVGIARQIMRLTDSTAKVKPEEFEAKLASVPKSGELPDGMMGIGVGRATTNLPLLAFTTSASGELKQ